MRHRVVKAKLSRDRDHRHAMLITMSEQLIDHGTMDTTVVKAKAIKPMVEKLITKARDLAGSEDKIAKFNLVKLLRRTMKTESIIKKLVDEVGPAYKGRDGGYLRIVKTGNRDGDNAETARIELVKEASK